MGGQQSLIAAGLNRKVTAILVNEPSGADSNGDLHGRKAGNPNSPSTAPQVAQTARYFDTVNFPSRIQAPARAAVGFIDTTAPRVGIWTAFNQIRSYPAVNDLRRLPPSRTIRRSYPSPRALRP